jgi:hypothetical protein
MLARVLNTNTTGVVKRAITMIDSRRYASYGGAVQHGSDHDEVDHHGHHDQSKIIYERLWQHKATLDWLPKPEGNWQEINGKKQAYYNQLLYGGIAAFALSLVYLRTVIVARSGALTQPPYHLIGNEDFPGSKYDDAAGAKE